MQMKRLAFLFMVFLVLGIVLWARFSLLVATVISTSMLPTLEIGDRVLAVRHWQVRWLRKGQIVLFWPPEDYRVHIPEQYGTIPLIKRVVGLPGDIYIGRRISPSQNMNNYIHTEELKISLRHFIVRGDLEITTSAPLSIGPIPFDNLLALVVMKLPYKDRTNRLH
jgi:signal peptidase I